MPSFLLVSIVASVVLTVVLNLALRMLPGAGVRLEQGLRRAVERTEPPTPGAPRVRVVFPWKLMLIGSLVLTVVLNLLLRLGAA